MFLEEIKLPSDWYSLKMNQKTVLYVNIKQNVASLAPVFELHQTKMILGDILGQSIDFACLDKQILKIKNQINLQTNKIPLIDED